MISIIGDIGGHFLNQGWIHAGGHLSIGKIGTVLGVADSRSLTPASLKQTASTSPPTMARYSRTKAR